MKISLNWVKEFTDIDVPVEKLVEKIGAQLGEVEEVVHLGQKYEGVVIAKVISSEPHPNADKLIVCRIDDGKVTKGVKRDKDGYVQVVSRGINEHGEINVKEGALVAWIPPGCVVPQTFDKDQFSLEIREMRGVKSYGMLASAHELAISDDHSGVMEVDVEAAPGQSFAQAYGLDDYVVDIENKMFTHRPDCFGLLGVAREIAGIQQRPFKSPGWYTKAPKFAKANGLSLQVKNEIPKLSKRFMAVAVSGVTVRPSTFYNQSYLSKIGIKPINNIVDLTNYMMYLTGQPMHAYDYDKVKARSGKVPTLTVRHPKKGEKLKVLGGKMIEPKAGDIMIATDKELIGFGGVIGGADTEVDENTTNVIFECANFDLYTVRRTSMAHGLFTDAVTRFSKGQSPFQTDRVLARTLELMVKDSDSVQASEVIDAKHLAKTDNKPVDVSKDFINSRLGLSLSEQEIMKLLNNVEFDAHKAGSEICISVPFWRTDIEIPEDIVEEVGRLYGYDRLPLELPGKTMSPSTIDEELITKRRVRTKLAALGANEVLNYSFVHGNLLDKASQDKELAFRIENALSPDLQYYRLSLIPSLLEKIHPNIKEKYEQFALFEIGKVHGKSETDENGLPAEFGRVGMVVAAGKKSDVKADYFLAKHYLNQLYPKHSKITYERPGDTILDKHKLASQMLAPYEPKRSAVVFVDEKVAGVVGEYKRAVAGRFKLPDRTAGFEVFLSSLNKVDASGYKPLSKYPALQQDICLRTTADLSFAKVAGELERSIEKNSPPDINNEIECIDIFQKDKKHKQTTFRVSTVSYERTLANEVVSNILEKVAAELQKSIKAERI